MSPFMYIDNYLLHLKEDIMKRVIRANTNLVKVRFELGRTYEYPMLYGGTAKYKVVDRTATTVTFAESHIAEDTGELVADGTNEYPIILQDLYDERYDHIIGEQESVQIWEYKGHKGYLRAGE